MNKSIEHFSISSNGELDESSRDGERGANDGYSRDCDDPRCIVHMTNWYTCDQHWAAKLRLRETVPRPCTVMSLHSRRHLALESCGSATRKTNVFPHISNHFEWRTRREGSPFNIRVGMRVGMRAHSCEREPMGERAQLGERAQSRAQSREPAVRCGTQRIPTRWALAAEEELWRRQTNVSVGSVCAARTVIPQMNWH